jgi:hypothetical protein
VFFWQKLFLCMWVHRIEDICVLSDSPVRPLESLHTSVLCSA